VLTTKFYSYNFTVYQTRSSAMAEEQRDALVSID